MESISKKPKTYFSTSKSGGNKNIFQEEEAEICSSFVPAAHHHNDRHTIDKYLLQEEEEEDNGDEICSSSVVADALNGDQQAIDKYLSSFPRGVRFEPLDYELVEYYLYNKINNQPMPINNIIELDIYKHNPYDLAAMYKPLSNYNGKKRWYFITPRDRKYPKGNRPNRAAGDGYWKATGTDTPIECEDIQVIGSKKALVFYKGKAKPPGGVKTSWIMYEYTIESTTTRAKTHADDMRLDDYVLVRIHEKPPPAKAPKAGVTRSKVGGNNKAPKENSRNKAPKAKRIKGAVVDHANDNNQIVANTVDQITRMNHPPSNDCDLLAAPVSYITSTNYAGDGFDEVRQLLSSSPSLQIAFSDLYEKIIMSEHLVPSTYLDSVYQGYQGNQTMEPIMGADHLYRNSSDGFLEGITNPDGSFASQTLNDVEWDNLAYGMFAQPTACNGFQIMSNVVNGDLPRIE